MKNKSAKPLNAKQQKFCKARAAGFTHAASYLKAGYNPSTPELAGKNGFILAKKPHVAAYIQKLRAASFSEQSMSLAEKRATLGRIVRTSPSEVDASSPLCQSYTHEIGTDGRATKKVLLPDKLKAIDLDNRLSGDYERDRRDIPNNPFLFLIALGKPGASLVSTRTQDQNN